MKLRLLPIGISLLVSLAVLFGGWFLYDSYAMETPLNEVVKETPGVQNATVDITKDKVTIHFTPSSDANLRDIYASITSRGASVIGTRTVTLDPASTTSSELDRWWGQAMFDVAQAMESKQYGAIPKRLEALKAQYSGLSVDTEMDEVNVYVTLHDGEGKSKFIILPRQPQKIGVWPNE
ncbi:heavy-metal-associated domain-containing protein [Paenibacillus sp. HJGM_3]|uniref:heavy-metal-associated domain-containing protein n=1 Tax=Paenibacillus sp. HJGM_3 TaxID=3379816 RepID=UPI00385A22BC